MERTKTEHIGNPIWKAIKSVFELFTWMFKWPFALLGLPAAVYFVQKWSEEQKFVWLQWALVFVYVVFLIILAGWVWSKGGIPAAFRELRRYGVLVPFIFAYNVLFSYISIFALLVFLIPHETFFVGVKNPGIGRLYDFFMWHFFDTIPVFDFTDAVLWKNKLNYVPENFPDEDIKCWGPHIIGWILLIFKVLIVVPVIGLIKLYFKGGSGKDQENEDKKS